MIPGVIATRYAKALLELGSESGQLDALVEEMSRFATTYESSSELRSTLDAPLIGPDAKKAVLADIGQSLGVSQLTKNAIGLLLSRRRIRALPAIAARLREMADNKRGILRAEIITAMPLPEEYFGKLQRELERVTGRKIALDRKLDPTLICGVVARVGDKVYDGSLLARLRQLHDSMLPN